MIKVVRNLGLWIWMLLIFVMSSIPSSSLPEISFILSDKLAHLAVYFILGILAGWKFGDRGGKSNQFSGYWLAFSLSAFYGVADEVHQLVVPGRQCDMWDLLFDVFGAALGVIYIKFRLRAK